MEEQLIVSEATRNNPALTAKAREMAHGGKVTMSVDGKNVESLKTITAPLTVSGNGFKAVFDPANGQLSELEYNGKAMIEPGNGLRLDAFRAYVNNDNWVYPSCTAAASTTSKPPPVPPTRISMPTATP